MPCQGGKFYVGTDAYRGGVHVLPLCAAHSTPITSLASTLAAAAFATTLSPTTLATAALATAVRRP